LALAAARETQDGAAVIVFLHGFGQDHRCLGPVADALARAHRLITPDLPRHGASRAIGGTFEEDAAHLAAQVTAPAVWLGYSMGGRYALRVALERPELVRALITIGASPGIEDAGARARRLAEDEALAASLERDGTAAFFDRWLSRPMFAGVPASAQFRAEREAQDPRALADALRSAGPAAMEPLWPRLGALVPPATFLAGARDVPYVAASRRMAAMVPGGRAVAEVIEGAGHAAHLEAPEATLGAIERALARAVGR
jgi:2-succinyl-6-hydroxy-2,4-cyclohexadiene-1-carboxylate synthase